MAQRKISELEDGGILLPGDVLPVVREGLGYRATYSNDIRLNGTAANGSDDDAAAILAGMEAAAAVGGVLDGGGKTYKTNSVLLLNDPTAVKSLRMTNMTLDARESLDAFALHFQGALAGDIALVADALRGDEQLELDNVTDLFVGQKLWLCSDKKWSTGANVENREFVIIAAIDTGTNIVSLNGQVMHNYVVDPDHALVKPVIMMPQIIIDSSVRIIGNPAVSQKGARFQYCEGAIVEDFFGEDLDDRHVEFATCYDFWAAGIRAYRANTAGLAYGVAITDGCQKGFVEDVSAYDMRFGVAVGGTNGVCRDIIVRNVKGYGLREGSINTHAGAEFITFEGFSDLNPSLEGVTRDGVVMNGINLTLKNGDSDLVGRHGVYCAPQVDDNGSTEAYIVLHDIKTRQSSQVGILLDNVGSQPLTMAEITKCFDSRPGGVSNPFNIFVRATWGNIENLHVSGNTGRGVAGAGGNCVQIIRSSQDSGTTVGDIKRTVMQGNILARDDDAAANIQLSGYDGTRKLANVVGAGNILENGNYGVKGTNFTAGTGLFHANANSFLGMATGATNGL